MSASIEDRPGPRTRAYHVGNVPTTLLDVARGLLREGGMSGLDLRTLANRAGVALGSVYHHFSSKADLLAALGAQGFAELQQCVSEAAAGADGRLVRACTTAYFDFAWREPNLYSLMFEPQVSRAEEVRRARAATFDAVEAIIASSPAAQNRTPAAIHSVAVAVWTCAHGAASLAPIHEEGGELVEAMIRGLEELFLAGRENRSYPNTVQGS